MYRMIKYFSFLRKLFVKWAFPSIPREYSSLKLNISVRQSWEKCRHTNKEND